MEGAQSRLLTGSALLVGLTGLIRTSAPSRSPASLDAGAIVDRADRKRLRAPTRDWLLTFARSVLLAPGHIQVWHIDANSAFNSFTSTFQNPT